MKTRTTAIVGVLALCFFAVMGVLVFAAGGIVARHQISPFVAIVDAAETNVKTLVKTVKGESDNEEYFTSAYYQMKMTTYETSSDGNGDHVGFVELADGYLMGRRAGELKFVRIDDNKEVVVQTLAASIPTNKDAFLADSGDMNYRLHVQFGAKDILTQEIGDGRIRLYATHHYWKQDEQCAVLRLSALETTPEQLLQDAASAEPWVTVFDTTPCMPLDSTLDHLNEDNAFLQSGGRLALLNDTQLLMTVGDHFYDAIHNDNLVQDPNASYGKVMRISLAENVADSRASMYSMGHRNPQGLYVDGQGNIWSTEHGPRGGDELNLVEEGVDYGWPVVSYGTDYSTVDWPEHLNWAEHEGFREPVMAWVPSIAANSVIRLEDSGFARWDNDLLVTSLKDKSIHRLHLVDGRVVVWERISIGSRVRDLMQLGHGRLLLLTDDGKLVILEALTNDDNQELPAELQAAKLWVNCDSCHTLESGGGHSAGPNLHDIVGKDIARFDDFPYSDALKNLDGTWTPEKLDKFLLDPQAFAPGTVMMFGGFKDPADRQAIIRHLQEQ